MQIFQWLFKAADEQGVQNHTTRKDKDDKPKDIVPSKNNNRRSKIDSSRSTHHRQQQSHSQSIMKMKKEGFVVVSQKSDSSKVSPLSEAQVAVSSSTNEKKDKKSKPISHMKELLRWAASAKKEKGRGKMSKKVDGRRLSISESPKISFRWDAESCSSISSTISGISMTSSSRNGEAYNLVSLNSTVIHGLNRCSSRRGNWITTDSEFVVLEL